MKAYKEKKRIIILALAAIVTLVVFPVLASAAMDDDLDGIDDALELIGGPGLTFGNFTYLPCPANTTIIDRYRCLSPTSKDIFIYLVPSCSGCPTPAGGGFLASNGLIMMSTVPVNATQCASTTSSSCTGLFGFIIAPKTATTTGRTDGLGVGIHVAVVSSAPASRAVGVLGQQAITMTVDEVAEAFAFGATDVGTPSNTGRSTIWPVHIKNYLTRNIFGGVDTPNVWKAYIQRTASHELSHAAALTASKDRKLNQYHYATGYGTVMDNDVQCSSTNRTCVIFHDYASGDIPCLLSLVSPTTNPLKCAALPVVP